MSTRSNIAIVHPDGTVQSIYVHSDGYPSGVGATLLNHYTDVAKVKELISLGGLSSLGEVIGEKHDFDWMNEFHLDWDVIHADPRYKMCNAYGRDRGEKGTRARKHKSFGDALRYCDNEYTYFFSVTSNVWTFSDHGGPIQLLTAKVCK